MNKTAKQIRRELEQLISISSTEPEVMLRYLATNKSQRDLVLASLGVLSSSVIPSRAEGARKMLELEARHKDQLDTFEQAITRDNDLKQLLEAAGPVVLFVPEGGQGPSWGRLSQYSILGSLSVKQALPGGTSIQKPLARRFGRQVVTVDFPTGVKAAVQVEVLCELTPLPSDVEQDAALIGASPLSLQDALSDLDADSRLPPGTAARRLLGRLLTLQSEGYSKAQIHERSLGLYRGVAAIARTTALREQLLDLTQRREASDMMIVAVPEGEDAEGILRRKAEEVVQRLRASAGPLPITFSLGRFDRQFKTLSCTIYHDKDEVQTFSLRLQPSWLPRFLEADLRTIGPSEALVDEDQLEELSMWERRLEAALKAPEHRRSEELRQVAGALYQAGKEDSAIARKAIGYYAAAKAGVLREPRERLTYLRLFLQLAFGDPTKNIRLSANQEFEYDRLRDFLRLIGRASDSHFKGRRIAGPLAESAQVLSTIAESKDDDAVYSLVQEVIAISPQLFRDLLRAFGNVRSPQAVAELGFRLLSVWLKQPKASVAVPAETLIYILTTAGILGLLRAQLEEDLLDYLEDGVAFIHGLDRRDPRAARDRLLEMDRSLELMIDEGSQKGTRTLIEEANYLRHALLIVRKEVDRRSKAYFGEATLQVECDTQIALFGRDSRVHFSLRNVGAGLASRVAFAVNIHPPHTLVGVPGDLPAMAGGEARGVTLAIAAGSMEPVLMDIKVTFSDQTAHGKECSRLVALPVVRAEDFRRIPKIYTPGQPCADPRLFVGRVDVLRAISSTLAGERGNPLVLLHGKRRIGKTSVLAQLRGAIQGKWSDVGFSEALKDFLTAAFCDLETVEQRHSTNFIKARLLLDVEHSLRQAGVDTPTMPSLQASEEQFDLDAAKWTSTIADSLRDYSYRVLVLIDEFDQVLAKRPDDAALYGWLRELILRHGDVMSFVYVGADRLITMMQDRTQRLFGMAGLPVELHGLQYEEAKDLATKPIREKAPEFQWHDEALERFLGLCGGNPYYIHFLGDQVVELCNRECRQSVQVTDVDDIVEETIAGLPGVKADLEDLDSEEKIVLAALAEGGARRVSEVFIDDGLRVVREMGIALDADRFLYHVDKLETLYLLRARIEGGHKVVEFTNLLLREFLLRRVGLRQMALSGGYL